MRRTLHDPATNAILAEIEFVTVQEWKDPEGVSDGWQAESQIISEYPGLRQAELVVVRTADGRAQSAILSYGEATGVLLQSSSRPPSRR